MKTSRILLAVAMVCGLAACEPRPKAEAPVAASPAPDAFLEGLYAHYKGDPADATFSPVGSQAPQWFDQEMVGLMAEDTRLANGEVGALDGDPICDCQDFGKLSANIKITQSTETTAKAEVQVTETDPSFSADARQPRAFTYDLVQENGAWRIHDIGTKDMPSLHDWLAKSNADVSSR